MKPLIWMRAIRDSDLPMTARHAANVIALRADIDGYCWPSYSTIARDMGAGRSTALRGVQRLVADGWLLKVARTNEQGAQSNSYRLVCPVDKAVDNPVDNGGGGVRETLGVVSERHPRVVSERHPEGLAHKEVSRSQPNGQVSDLIAAVARTTRL